MMSLRKNADKAGIPQKGALMLRRFYSGPSSVLWQSHLSQPDGDLSWLITMPEIRETMECACAEFEQRDVPGSNSADGKNFMFYTKSLVRYRVPLTWWFWWLIMINHDSQSSVERGLSSVSIDTIWRTDENSAHNTFLTLWDIPLVLSRCVIEYFFHTFCNFGRVRGQNTLQVNWFSVSCCFP